jgi:hypothetical protein
MSTPSGFGNLKLTPLRGKWQRKIDPPQMPSW